MFGSAQFSDGPYPTFSFIVEWTNPYRIWRRHAQANQQRLTILCYISDKYLAPFRNWRLKSDYGGKSSQNFALVDPRVKFRGGKGEMFEPVFRARSRI